MQDEYGEAMPIYLRSVASTIAQFGLVGTTYSERVFLQSVASYLAPWIDEDNELGNGLKAIHEAFSSILGEEYDTAIGSRER